VQSNVQDWLTGTSQITHCAPDTRPLPRAGVSARVIMKQTGHRFERMVRRYIREGELCDENSAARLGL